MGMAAGIVTLNHTPPIIIENTNLSLHKRLHI